MKRMLLAVAISCAAQAQLPKKPPGPPPPVVTAARVQAALPELEKFVQDTMRTTGVPGVAVGVVFEGRTVYLKGFGLRAVGHPETVDPDTVFQLASVSKPLASTVVAALVKDGKLKWDDLVVTYDPTFALQDPWVTAHVTLADLFSHRSGLPDHAGDLLEDLGYGRDEVLQRLRYEPLTPFRARWFYTNFGLTEAAVAAARAAGQPWEELCQQKLYGPLGMTATSSRYSDYARRPDRALLHVRIDGRWEPKFTRQPDAQTPAGGVSSSVRDMTKWVALQLASDDETHLPHMLMHAPSSFYGLGWNVSTPEGRLDLNHSGAFASGAATCVRLMPGEKFGIVALTNGMPIGVPEAICDVFTDKVLHGEVQRDWLGLRTDQFNQVFYSSPPKYVTPPSMPLAARGGYAGTYSNRFYGPARVVEEKGSYVLLLGPGPQRYPLRHWNGEKFVMQTRGENAVGLTGVTFTPQSLNVEYLDEEKLGTFLKN